MSGQAARQKCRRGAGFTLAEVLVTIGIVTILMGLVYSVYPRVKAGGKQSACLSNLHQIGAAVELYANDSDGALPPFELCSITCDPVVVPADISPTHAEIRIPTNADGFKNALNPYMRSAALWWCPADSYKGQKSVGANGQDDSFTSYVRGNVFQKLAVNFGQPGHSLNDLTAEQRVRAVVLADRCFKTSEADGPDACQTSHGFAQNSLFADGSVKNIPVTRG